MAFFYTATRTALTGPDPGRQSHPEEKVRMGGPFHYGYEDHGHKFPSHRFRVWPSAELRTSSGEVFAQVAPEVVREATGSTLQV